MGNLLHDHNLNDLLFHLGGAKPAKFKDVAANKFVLTTRAFELEGYLDVPETKVVTVDHVWGGQILMRRQMKANRGEFNLGIELMRGTNTIMIWQEEGTEPFKFDLVYKTPARDWIESFVKAFILVVVVKTFIVQAFYIPTGSMEDTLLPLDYILVDKVSYLFEEPEVGDIIVFQFPQDRTKDFIKRMVAAEGDSIEMRRKRFLRNGAEQNEPWAINKDFRLFLFGLEAARDNWGPIEVPKNHVFAMGDNRDNSRDSRFWGPLPKYRLKGRAFCIYYPAKRWRLIRHGKEVLARAAAAAKAAKGEDGGGDKAAAKDEAPKPAGK